LLRFIPTTRKPNRNSQSLSGKRKNADLGEIKRMIRQEIKEPTNRSRITLGNLLVKRKIRGTTK